MGTGPLLKMESAGRRGKEIVPTRSLKEIMNPPGAARITQMSDFLKVFCPFFAPWGGFAPTSGGQ